MSLLVLNYPKFSKKDFEWIQNIRKKYDDRYFNIVSPHFTIVFPIIDINQKNFIRHITEDISGFNEINFTARCAVPVKDTFSEYTDIFLVPDEGYSKIVKLHDKLYSTFLKDYLRLDIPFIPHIGIGGSLNPNESRTIADNLNALDFSISGIIDKLNIVTYNYPEVKTIREINLDKKINRFKVDKRSL